MQSTFLNSYPKLITPANTQSAIKLTGLWLAHGDEPVLTGWLVDAMRPHWQTQNLAIKRIELVSSKTWDDVLAELNSLSLFDDASAIIVTGNHKPDKATQAALEEFGSQSQTDSNQNCLLWLVSKQDKRAQKSKWFTLFNHYGHVIDCHIYDERQRQQLLQLKAQQFGLQLSNDAWQLLMIQTEHHLLSSYQTLWRLSYLFAPNLDDIAAAVNAANSTTNNATNTTLVNIDVEALQNALVSESHYSVFDLSDAMLAGNSKQVVKIIEQLKATDEPTPLVLWAISKEMRLIMQLIDGQDPQKIGIWSSKQSLYQQACRRQTANSISGWSAILYRCDQAVKGVIKQPAWELLLQAALLVCGHQLFAY
ncbi:DNA polymerase III subunit delta [Psychrobacter sp. I-STPA10]|uniref:DNA polymerase III subunit delta n=1 Tax=Psychrobacter sp. I-STPA10 TaxID=2585769 RepID=UPI001E396AF5|nr:DNA polymerase III subunit delta [Psychrobacter sp. I-STPA10]